MRFRTMWYVRPAKPQIRAFASRLSFPWLLSYWLNTILGFKLKRRLQRFVRVYTCQNVKLLEISCAALFVLGFDWWMFKYNAREKCFGDLGCFSSSSPYTNTQGLLPRSPRKLSTKFLVTNRDLDGRVREIVINAQNTTKECNLLLKNKETKLIIHGYRHSVHKKWVKDMTSALLTYVSKLAKLISEYGLDMLT